MPRDTKYDFDLERVAGLGAVELDRAGERMERSKLSVRSVRSVGWIER